MIKRELMSRQKDYQVYSTGVFGMAIILAENLESGVINMALRLQNVKFILEKEVIISKR